MSDYGFEYKSRLRTGIVIVTICAIIVFLLGFLFGILVGLVFG